MLARIRTPQHDRYHSQRQSRRGAALVEFAVTAPLLFLVALATVEFTRLSMIRHTADNAAYEAARHVIVPGATVAEAENLAEAMLSAVGVPAASVEVDVTPSPITESTGAVTVDVEVPMSGNAWFLPAFSENVTVRSTSTLLTERQPSILAGSIPQPPGSGSGGGGGGGGDDDDDDDDDDD